MVIFAMTLRIREFLSNFSLHASSHTIAIVWLHRSHRLNEYNEYAWEKNLKLLAGRCVVAFVSEFVRRQILKMEQGREEIVSYRF